MDLAQLKTLGAFVSAEPVRKTVKWGEHTFDIHVRLLSYGTIERLAKLKGDDTRGLNASLIAESVLLGDKLEPMKYEDADRLNNELGILLAAAVYEVNGEAQVKKA